MVIVDFEGHCHLSSFCFTCEMEIITVPSSRVVMRIIWVNIYERLRRAYYIISTTCLLITNKCLKKINPCLIIGLV